MSFLVVSTNYILSVVLAAFVKVKLSLTDLMLEVRGLVKLGIFSGN